VSGVTCLCTYAWALSLIAAAVNPTSPNVMVNRGASNNGASFLLKQKKEKRLGNF